MKKILKFICLLVALAIVAGLCVAGYYAYEGYQMYQKAIQEKSIEDRISEIRSKSGYITIDQIPLDFKHAIIAVEDHRFESHGAVDFISIARAIYVNITKQSMLQRRKYNNTAIC